MLLVTWLYSCSQKGRWGLVEMNEGNVLIYVVGLCGSRWNSRWPKWRPEHIPTNETCPWTSIVAQKKLKGLFGYTFSVWKERLDIGCCISSKLTSRPGFWVYAKLVQMQSEKTKGKRSKRQLLLFSRRPSTSVNFVDTPVLLSPCRCSYSRSLDSLLTKSTIDES